MCHLWRMIRRNPLSRTKANHRAVSNRNRNKSTRIKRKGSKRLPVNQIMLPRALRLAGLVGMAAKAGCLSCTGRNSLFMQVSLRKWFFEPSFLWSFLVFQAWFLRPSTTLLTFSLRWSFDKLVCGVYRCLQ